MSSIRDDCAFCLEELVDPDLQKRPHVAFTDCQHIFHANCLMPWIMNLEQRDPLYTCPYCNTPRRVWPLVANFNGDAVYDIIMEKLAEMKRAAVEAEEEAEAAQEAAIAARAERDRLKVRLERAVTERDAALSENDKLKAELEAWKAKLEDSKSRLRRGTHLRPSASEESAPGPSRTVSFPSRFVQTAAPSSPASTASPLPALDTPEGDTATEDPPALPFAALRRSKRHPVGERPSQKRLRNGKDTTGSKNTRRKLASHSAAPMPAGGTVTPAGGSVSTAPRGRGAAARPTARAVGADTAGRALVPGTVRPSAIRPPRPPPIPPPGPATSSGVSRGYNLRALNRRSGSQIQPIEISEDD